VHARAPLDLGSIAGLRVFWGKPYPTLGELDVFAFVAAGFLADAFVDLDAVAAWTLEVGIAGPAALLFDSRPALNRQLVMSSLW